MGMALNPQTKEIKWQHAVSWLLCPLLYVIYSLIRGALINWHSYSFLDPRINGYGSVFLYSVGIGIAIGFICVLVKTLGNRSLRFQKI
ncbi:Pr6Pr family membrane protein [Bacillus sp. SY8(2021)]|uniref:Pr6Pr family membrane protein n=2 Tax=Bacillus arachidis TaxID=2819290 RepID=A0ABS3NXC0_9BACI|nr:Pr6Pr family membrane protein [Bacillus arachidis]